MDRKGQLIRCCANLKNLCESHFRRRDAMDCLKSRWLFAVLAAEIHCILPERNGRSTESQSEVEHRLVDVVSR